MEMTQINHRYCAKGAQKSGLKTGKTSGMSIGMAYFEHHIHTTFVGPTAPPMWMGKLHWHQTPIGPTNAVEATGEHKHVMPGTDGNEVETGGIFGEETE